ncbi:GcrA family cell cycle regulator [Methylobacterium durans]|uniref:GcrA cell cycle regulator n=1 Tax=Methylobacterium durans TaxID=2202825 RepID=A0A2U8W6S4_9HYPH|nr:hypothetical protein DK389_16250 [Methylobacterium durans]
MSLRVNARCEKVGEFGMTAVWDEPRVELLNRLWISGEPARAISEKLGEGITRNAVIGKAHRLGLTGKHGSQLPAPAGPRRRALNRPNLQPPREPRPKTRSH